MSGIDPKGPFPSAPRERLFGLYPAVVTDVADPAAQGRVQVELPWVDAEEGAHARTWARLSTMMAGPGRGTWFVPEVGDEVVLAFLGGDSRWPVVTGALWNGVDAPPEVMGPANDLRSITTRAGHRLRFDDGDGGGLTLVTAGGHRLELAEGGSVTLSAASGASITLDPSGKIILDSPLSVELNAVQLTVNAPVTKFSGLVQADTVVTNTIVAAAYTPGTGNVW